MKFLFAALTILIGFTAYSQDTIPVRGIDLAIEEAQKGNFVSLGLIGDTNQTFPKEFFEIPREKLVGLVIDNCSYGSIPNSVSSYRNLFYFRYSWFYFSESPLKLFPDFISQTPSLQQVIIEGVPLKGIPSLSELTSLDHLSIYKCDLPNFPLEVLELKSLTELKLACNDFTRIPDGISKLSNLKILEFEGGACGATPISHVPPSIGQLKKLESFSLGYSKEPVKELPESFYSLQNLKRFSCHGCGLESLNEKVTNLKQLESLQLTNLSFFQEFPEEVFKLPNLKRFRFYQYGDSADQELLEQQARIKEWGKSLESFDFEINLR
ncbi:MAG: leucine-rich repeat domain-containing protein [Crocinitomicaceae bacterium]